MIQESHKFQEFMFELGYKENWKEESLTLDFDLRNKVYDGADGNCTAKSETANDFLDCLIKNREAMIDAIKGYE